MQIPTDTSVIQAPPSRGPSVQWIGVQWQGGFYALPLSLVSAVFKAAQTEADSQPTYLDVEVHDGAPVFMRSFEHCFELGLPAVPSLEHEEFRWALILNVPGGSPLGCRVHQVLGPFWDELKSESVHHDGQDWRLIQPRGGIHA
jgi:hypothetical protein